MSSLDGNIVNISLPTMSRYFGVGSAQSSWVVLGYILALSSTMLLFGKLSDLWGLKRVFLLGYGLFTGASLACALSPVLAVLILSRVVQGVGGSMLMVSAYGLIPKFLSGCRSGMAFGTLTTSAALGVTLGGPVGGLLTDYLSWQWIFLINVPVGVVATIAARSAIPAEESPRQSVKSLNLAGVILSVSVPLCLMLAMSMGRKLGFASGPVVMCLVGAAVLGVWFVARERRAQSPLIDLSLFRNRQFMFAVASMMFAIAFLAGSNFMIPFYLQTAKGMSAGQSGLTLLAYSIPLMIVGPLAGRRAGRIGHRVFGVIGMLIVIVACVTVMSTLSMSGALGPVCYLALMGFGFGLYNSPMNNHVMSCVPPEAKGSASGLFQMLVRTAMAFGVAVFEMLFSGSPSTSSVAGAFRIPFATGAVLAAIAIVFIVAGGHPGSAQHEPILD